MFLEKIAADLSEFIEEPKFKRKITIMTEKAEITGRCTLCDRKKLKRPIKGALFVKNSFALIIIRLFVHIVLKIK